MMNTGHVYTLLLFTFHCNYSTLGDADSATVSVDIHDDVIVARVSPYFISVALDTGLALVGWEGMNFRWSYVV